MELLAWSHIVEDPVDMSLARVIDDCRLRFRGRLADSGWCIAVEPRDMGNIMLADRIWKVYFVSILIDDLWYRVWSCPFVIQYLWRWCHSDMPCWTTVLFSNLETNLFPAGVSHLTSWSLLQVIRQSLVSLLPASCESVCLYLGLQARWWLRGLKLHHRIVVVSSTQCCYPLRPVYCVIVSEFS